MSPYVDFDEHTIISKYHSFIFFHNILGRNKEIPCDKQIFIHQNEFFFCIINVFARWQYMQAELTFLFCFSCAYFDSFMF
jgi:hypothetical protein